MNKLLYPLSFAYGLLSKIDRKFKHSEKLGKPVISVGNITWGGTGKTPLVIELLNFLADKKYNPAVLTRGYGRADETPVLLKDGACGIKSNTAGDEPLLIAKSVPAAKVIVGAQRYKNALKFEKEAGADVFILDDGFQHWKIARDLDIVCINAANPFGNGMLIPSGILREKPPALKRAGMIVITNADMVTPQALDNLKETVFAISSKEAVVTSYGNYGYKQIDLQKDFDINKFGTSGVYSLSAVGFAGGFKNSIEKSGVKVKGSFVLKDHYRFDRKKILDFIEKSEGLNLVVTAKDAVKIESFADEKIKEKVAVLTVTPVFQSGKEKWEKEILSALRSS